MTLRRTFVLREDRNAQALWAFLKANWKAMAESGKPLQVEVAEEKSCRSRQANARYWAILGEISAQAWVDGRQYAPDVWHEHFKRSLLGVDDLPSGQTMGKSTAKLNTQEFSEFMEAVEAYACTELGVQFVEVLGGAA